MTSSPGDLQRTRLSNGLRVVTVARPASPLAAVKLFFRVGSRHDGPSPGLAHFLEHLLFSGPTGATQALYRAVEDAGGEANAVTTREYTALQAVVLASHAERAVDLFADVLEAARFDPEAVERERRVILNEIELHSDSYQVIWDLFLQALWDGHPLAGPIVGTPEAVTALTAGDLAAHWLRYQAPDRMVLAAAGHVDHDRLVDAAQARWGRLPPGPALSEDDAGGRGTGHAFLPKDTHQTHLALGVEGVRLADPRRYALRLLDIVLGRGARSRLHRALRIRRGLVYDVSSLGMSYADRGYLAVYTACPPEAIETVSAAILAELDQVRREGVSEEELEAAKTHYQGSLARNFETVLSLAGIVGVEELLDRIVPFSESTARIQALTTEEVRRTAEEILTLDRYALALVGRRPEHA